MARFYGKIGYAYQKEVKTSIWRDVVEEQLYYGETVDRSWKYQNETDQVNDNLVLDTDFEIIADAFMLEHFSNIRYICYGGARWKVTSIKYDPPRAHLRIGGLYNGKTPEDAV